jgi:hypothetical protein
MAGQQDDRTGMRPAPEPPSGSADGTRAERWAEILAAVVLSLATVLTAWSAFEATKWSGVMAIRFSEANAARTQSAQASATANAKRTIDVTVFAEYLSAVATDERELVAFLQERFRDEFKPAFQAWARQRPRTNPAAPPTPFAMAEYRIAEDAESARLAELADVRGREAREANQRGDNYVLVTVLFASVLFFAGISTKFAGRGIKLGLGILAAVVLVSGIIVLATFPVEI